MGTTVEGQEAITACPKYVKNPLRHSLRPRPRREAGTRIRRVRAPFVPPPGRPAHWTERARPEKTRRGRLYVLRVETGAGCGSVPRPEGKGRRQAVRRPLLPATPSPASALKGLDGQVGRDGSSPGGGGGGRRRRRLLLLAPAPAVIGASGRGSR